MNFTSVMQNLAIGIASGIFSSIIVSVVFYLLNELQTELNKANDMVYPIYGITVFGKTIVYTENDNELEVVNGYFNEAIENFSRFEPWKFKNCLHDAMCEINSIIMDGKYSDDEMILYPEMVDELSQKLQVQLNIMQNFEKHFAKELAMRIFKNKIIIVTIIIFIAVIISA